MKLFQRITHSLITLSIIFGVLAGILDGAIETAFFERKSVIDALFLDISPADIYLRSSFLLMFVAFGVLVSRLMAARRKTEEELRFQSEIVNNMAEGVQITRMSDRTIIYTNARLEEMFGYDHDELIGKHVSTLNAPGEQSSEQTAEAIISALKEKGVWRGEVDNIKKDGTPFWCRVGVSAFEHPRYGEVWISVHEDITERKLAETLLKISEAEHRLVLQTATDGILRLDLQGRILEVNKAYCLMSGYSEKELLTMGIKDFEAIETSPEIAGRMRKVLAQGDDRFETKHRRKDGSVIDVEVVIQYRPEAGEFLTGFVRDISGRKRTEELQRLQAEVLGMAVESIDLHDFDGNFIYVNQAAYISHGYTKEEFLKTNVYRLDTPESSRLAPMRMKELLEKGRGVFEISHFHKDGSIMHLEIHTAIVELGGRKLIMTVAHDTTERKKMQEQLVMQDRLASIGQLVSGVAHELNNPLTIVIGFSDILLQKELPEDVKGDLRLINNEALRTAEIVRNLLTFARGRAGEKQAININESIQTVLQLRAHQQEVNNIKTNTCFAPDLPRVMGNNSQLQQVFFNIILNAEQAMLEAHDKGTLAITTERAGDFIRATFTDDGPGMSAETLQRLFTPFFTTKEVGKGTGLGLSISQGIVSEHGGRIWAESSPGRGATFFVELPNMAGS